MLSPYLTIANRQVDSMLRVATEFGSTPASRGLRLSMPKSDSGLLDSEHSGMGLKELGDVPELSQLKMVRRHGFAPQVRSRKYAKAGARRNILAACA